MNRNTFRVFFIIFLFVMTVPSVFVLQATMDDIFEEAIWHSIFSLSVDKRAIVFLLPMLTLMYFATCVAGMFVLIIQIFDNVEEDAYKEALLTYKLEKKVERQKQKSVRNAQ